MKRKFGAVFAFLLVFYGASAQIWVTHTRSEAAYHGLEGTQLLKDSVWYIIDYPGHPDVSIPLGFDFDIYGTLYSSVELGNGSLWFGTGIFLGSMADMVDRGYGSGQNRSQIYVKTDGISPNRIVKIEWRDAGFYDEYLSSQTLYDSMSFQVWIYETGKKFECRIGNNNLHTQIPNDEFITFGIVNVVDSAQNYLLKGAPTNPEFTHEFISPYGLELCPASGTVYTFSFGTVTGMKKIGGHSGFYYADKKLFSATATPVTIYDVQGRLMLNGTAQKGSLSLAQFSAGVYVAKQGTQVLKFVLE